MTSRRSRRWFVALAALVVAVQLVGCGNATVDQAEVEGALDSVAAWLAVDDDPVTTPEAVQRADRLLAATAPVVEARPDLADLTAAETAAFHDALAALRDSVEAQRDVLVACEVDDPGTCLARSDLDPAALQATVEQFQDALDPVLTPTPAA